MQESVRMIEHSEDKPVVHVQARKVNWSAYLYILPALLLFAVFVVYPVLFNVVLSFNRWNGMSQIWEPVGLANFEQLINDRAIRLSLRNSGFFILGHLVTMSLALTLAILLSRPTRLNSIIRTLIFLPGVLASTIIAVTWSTIFETNLGALNTALRNVGLGTLAQDWLGNPQIAIWSITVVGIWAGLGFPMVVYLASLQSINHEITDAAQVDGANALQIFRYITFPLLRNTHLVLFMLGVIASLQSFDVAQVLTGGGPYNATTSLTIQIYKNVFDFGDFGYGAALSQFTLILLVALTLLQRFFLRERDLS